MKRALLGICIVVALLAVSLAISFSYACEGARPLAMGGAFTGLADDANATYWNPAAMGLMKKTELTYTGTVYDRDVINYDDWLSMVFPLGSLQGNKGFDFGSVGLAFMNNIDKVTQRLAYSWFNYSAQHELTTRWYILSYGRELKELVEGLCIGANVRYATIDYEVNEALTTSGGTYTANSSDSDTWYGIDVSMYYLWQNLSIGFLFQDVNEPELTLFGSKSKYIANFRPGIAYRFGDRYILSAEVYNALEEGDTNRSFRIGGEAQVTDNIAVRLGGYGIDTADEAGRAITGGIGFSSKKLFENVDTELSYAVMHWYKSDRDTEDKFTHFVSLSFKF